MDSDDWGERGQEHMASGVQDSPPLFTVILYVTTIALLATLILGCCAGDEFVRLR